MFAVVKNKKCITSDFKNQGRLPDRIKSKKRKRWVSSKKKTGRNNYEFYFVGTEGECVKSVAESRRDGCPGCVVPLLILFVVKCMKAFFEGLIQALG